MEHYQRFRKLEKANSEQMLWSQGKEGELSTLRAPRGSLPGVLC